MRRKNNGIAYLIRLFFSGCQYSLNTGITVYASRHFCICRLCRACIGKHIYFASFIGFCHCTDLLIRYFTDMGNLSSGQFRDDVENIEGIEIKRERQDTVLVLKEIESNICQLKNDKRIDFLTDISLPSVNIDKSVLFRVLENLLQNAMRYMNEQIVVGVYQKDNLFLMSVKDDGKGFSEEDLRQATNMFYGKEKGNEHFGIGLGVCRLLCEKHGGFLEIGNNDISGANVIAALDILG